MIAEGSNNGQVAKRLGQHRECVRQWRERWLAGQATLAAAEAQEDDD